MSEVVCNFCGRSIVIENALKLPHLKEFYVCADCLLEWLSRLKPEALIIWKESPIATINKWYLRDKFFRLKQILRTITEACKKLEDYLKKK